MMNWQSQISRVWRWNFQMAFSSGRSDFLCTIHLHSEKQVCCLSFWFLLQHFWVGLFWRFPLHTPLCHVGPIGKPNFHSQLWFCWAIHHSWFSVIYAPLLLLGISEGLLCHLHANFPYPQIFHQNHAVSVLTLMIISLFSNYHLTIHSHLCWVRSLLFSVLTSQQCHSTELSIF